MNRWMDGWMDGWIDRWMDGWMDGWMYTLRFFLKMQYLNLCRLYLQEVKKLFTCSVMADSPPTYFIP